MDENIFAEANKIWFRDHDLHGDYDNSDLWMAAVLAAIPAGTTCKDWVSHLIETDEVDKCPICKSNVQFRGSPSKLACLDGSCPSHDLP